MGALHISAFMSMLPAPLSVLFTRPNSLGWKNNNEICFKFRDEK